MWNGNGNSMMRMTTMMMRYFSSTSRKRAPNLRKINPRVPFQEAAAIAEDLYGVVKSHGPLSIGNAWNLAKKWAFLQNGWSSDDCWITWDHDLQILLPCHPNHPGRTGLVVISTSGEHSFKDGKVKLDSKRLTY
ncbi:UNVERIFIED_CONTAM: hypothetical protein Sradi_6688100 [Sesamum radiatum]|uniref:Uncharacterized protein n=1 Tax=Sesamum radiatum TaxID=300843 RepID=A0AAW2JP52_SESRA